MVVSTEYAFLLSAVGKGVPRLKNGSTLIPMPLQSQVYPTIHHCLLCRTFKLVLGPTIINRHEEVDSGLTLITTLIMSKHYTLMAKSSKMIMTFIYQISSS